MRTIDGIDNEPSQHIARYLRLQIGPVPPIMRMAHYQMKADDDISQWHTRAGPLCELLEEIQEGDLCGTTLDAFILDLRARKKKNKDVHEIQRARYARMDGRTDSAQTQTYTQRERERETEGRIKGSM